MRTTPNSMPGLALCLVMAGACAPAMSSRTDAFSATGQVIAMGGGDAGPGGACFTCHGMGGAGDAALTPRLAGLPEGYLLKQMEDFADGVRPDAVMSPIARTLSPAARRRVSGYYAAMAGPALAAPAPLDRLRIYLDGAPERGIAPCADCHGPEGLGVGAANPPLAGQPAPYLAEQLRRWAAAERRNDPQGRMLQISQRLTAEEIGRLAEAFAAPPRPSAQRRERPATSR